MKQKEINKIGYDRLLAAVDSFKMQADKTPDKASEGYYVQSGKQYAYSHVWFELKGVVEDMTKLPAGYINWKIINLIIGFAVGGLFMWFALNGC